MDNVNHPPHYKTGSLEVIDAIEGLGLGFHASNVVKYVARYKLKGGVEDLKKAEFYIKRLIQLEEKLREGGTVKPNLPKPEDAQITYLA